MTADRRPLAIALMGPTASGKSALALEWAQRLDGEIVSVDSALVYLGLGQHDSALQWLERAYDAHDVHLVFPPVDPKWDPLRAEGRFADLLRRCAYR